MGGWKKLAFTTDTVSTANSVPWSGITGKPSTYTPSSHTHDDRYYTESEMNTKLAGKSDTGHTHDDRYYTESEINTKVTTLNNSIATKVTETTLTSAVDLNTLTTTGIYHLKFSGATNQPCSNHGVLYVDFSVGTPYQIFVPDGSTNAQYKRGYTTSSKTWSAWTTQKLTDTVYTHPSHTAYSSGLYKITTNSLGHVTAATAVTKSDITNLGIPGSDTNNKTTQTAVTASDYTDWRPIVWGASHSGTEGFTPTTVTDGVFTAQTLSVQPSSGTIRATTFKGNLSGNASTASAVAWSGITGKPSTYTPSSHTHTKSQITDFPTLGTAASKNTRTLTSASHSSWVNASTDQGYVPDMAFIAYWNGAFSSNGASNLAYCNRGAFGTIVTKNAGDYAAAGHTHSYAGSSSAGGSATSAVKLDTATAGSATQPVYFSGGKPVACTYTLGKSVPSNAVFTDTNTWRGIQNNLTSDSTTDSLSAAQGKVLKGLVDGKAASGHTHNSTLDSGNNTVTTFAYSKSGMNYGDYSWLAGWNGYELRAVHKNQFATAAHTHNYAGSSTVGGVANSANAVVGHTSGEGFEFGYKYTQTITIPKTTTVTTYYVKIAEKANFRFKNYYIKTVGNNTQYSFKAEISAQSYMNPHAIINTQKYNQPEIKYIKFYKNENATHDIYLVIDSSTQNTKTINISSDNSILNTLTTNAPTATEELSVSIDYDDFIYSSKKIKCSNVIGNASTATKATQDSAGQQINTTYIKNISASGRTVTFTRGDGTTGTFTTQDTNTTYSAATTSSAGLMSATDKSKLDGIASGANKFTYTHPSYTARSSGLYKITVDSTGHVSAVTSVAKADITALGIPGSDTNTWRPLGTTADTACAGNDSRLSNARPASDVSSWAKASTKPSYSWSEITGKPSTFTPSSHTHSNLVTVGDQRDTATTPNTYSNSFIFQGLKTNSKIGTPSSDTYSYVIGLRGWQDNSGGDSHEIAFNNSGIYARHGSSTSWNGWSRILDSSNYSSYAATVSHGHSDKMGSVTVNGYQGLARSDGNTTDWIRTTSAGIIPYQSGGFGEGHCGIGTSSWYFSTAYIDTTHGNLDGCSKTLARNGDVRYPMTFNWSGQGGQPTWLWGGENGTDMYVYNPSNFSVASLGMFHTNTYQGADDNTGNWANQKNSVHWYSSALMKKQPGTYMYVLNIAGAGQDVHQLGFCQPGGTIWHRGGNSSGWTYNDGEWDCLLDTRNFNSYYHITYSNGILCLNNCVNVLSDTQAIRVYGTNGTGIAFLKGSNWYSVASVSSSSMSLGTSENRWLNLYLAGNVIGPSDEYLKDIIPSGIDDRYEKFFMLLNPILYKWKNNDDQRSKINPHDRIHCGLGARETERHAIECGLDTISVAAICKDKLEKPTEDGRTDKYGIAYSELHGLEIHMIQKAHKKISELEEKNQKLETELQELKQLVQQLLNK